jgi:hypothetical protein
MFDRLTKTAGFPWAIRAIGFVALAAALLSIPALLSGSDWLKHKRKRRALFDKSALHDRLFLIFTCCSFSTFLGYIVPYFYIPTYARERLGSSESTALYMLVLSIAGSFFGRLVSGVLAHFLGAIVTWMLCAFASGILALSWISIERESTFIAFSILWGRSSPSSHVLHYRNLLESILTSIPRCFFCSTRYSTFGGFREHHPRSLTSGDAIRDELECVQYSLAHWSAHRRCPVEENKRSYKLHWCPSLEWSVFDDRDVLAGCSLDRDCEESEERVESIEGGVDVVKCVLQNMVDSERARISSELDAILPYSVMTVLQLIIDERNSALGMVRNLSFSSLWSRK